MIFRKVIISLLKVIGRNKEGIPLFKASIESGVTYSHAIKVMRRMQKEGLATIKQHSHNTKTIKLTKKGNDFYDETKELIEIYRAAKEAKEQ